MFDILYIIIYDNNLYFFFPIYYLLFWKNYLITDVFLIFYLEF